MLIEEKPHFLLTCLSSLMSALLSGTDKRIKLRTASIPGMTDLTEGLVSSLAHFLLFIVRLT